jgi:hypothetical protein
MKNHKLPLIIATLAILLCSAVPTVSAKSKGGGPSSPNTNAPTKPGAENPVAKIMETYDTNHDGELTPDEIRVFAAADQTNAQIAKGYDTDHDNTLSAVEIMNWHNDMAKKQAKPAAGAAASSKTPAAQ